MLLVKQAILATVLFSLIIRPAHGAEPEKLLPSDSEFVLAVNVRQIVDSDVFVKFLHEAVKTSIEHQESLSGFFSKLGFDPFNDIESILMAAAGINPGDARFMFIFHGKFDQAKLTKELKAQAKENSKEFSLLKDGQDLLFKYQPDDFDPIYCSLVDSNTIVLGNRRKQISTALAVARGDTPSIRNEQMDAAIKKVDKNASLYFLSTVTNNIVRPNSLNLDPDLRSLLVEIESVTLIVRMTTDVSIEVSAKLKTAGSAAQFSKWVDDGLSRLQLAAQNEIQKKPQLAPLNEVMKTIRSKVKDSSVSASARFTGAVIEQLLELVQQQ